MVVDSIGVREPHMRQPSIRRRLMVFLLVPAVALTLAESGMVYGVALRYSNYVHDADLSESVRGLASALMDSGSTGRLAPEARRLLEFDSLGRTTFAIRSDRHGLISGDGALAIRVRMPAQNTSQLQRVVLNGVPVEVASMMIDAPREAGDRLVLSIAESLHDRQHDALQILLLTIPIQTIAMTLLVASTWWGVRFGLQALDAPTRRLQDADHALAPISGADIPVEILPLTLTIDRLFARVRGLMALQDQFVADAAHQLRTPLAGLSMNVERALSRGEPSLQEMRHIQMLTARLTRTTTQLLSLTRAQVPAWSERATASLDLACWLPAAVASRVPDALLAGVDLGYEAGPDAASGIDADAGLLQELLDNLIDNALIYAGSGGSVTVAAFLFDTTGDSVVQDNGRHAGYGQRIGIAVEDSGPGIADAWLPRLGERFFRAPDAPEGGSGLGLAIVRRIAEVHGADVRFVRAGLGGLRVEVGFPVRRNGDLA
ncbi:MAG: sensor histidine kinase [Luteimonas sp.]